MSMFEDERRVWKGGSFWVYNTTTKEVARQLPVSKLEFQRATHSCALLRPGWHQHGRARLCATHGACCTAGGR